MSDLFPRKIQPRHLERLATIYIRQSDPHQQFKHPESVPTQLRLRERILQWGWPEDRICVLDGDLGRSATTTVGRDDFAWLVSEVTLGHVGLVAGFQINRLAREDEAICHLIKICSLFDTLLADQDGVYHPQDINDRLVLTIKGVVGGLELHQIQQRMQAGRHERARRGEWLGATPKGYIVGQDRKLVFDPDEQVQHTIRLIFEQFEHLGSISALLRYMRQHEIRLPVRENRDKIHWRRPHRESVRSILRHPAYAGAYTWGRRPIDPKRAVPGRRGTGRVVLEPAECKVLIADNHPAYIEWERFQRNIERLTSHRRHGPEPSPQREIVSLLAGRVFCGRCGDRMHTRYGPQLRYDCARRALDYGEPKCGSVPGKPIEQLAAEQILVALEPASLELSLAATEQIETERAQADKNWKLRLERADQDAQRAFRQYDAVEPENRLVARNLEKNWEEALQTVRTLNEEYHRFRVAQPTTLSEGERRLILELSTNLPRLWYSESVTVADRRRVVQLVLEKVVVHSSANELVSVELYWAGGTVTQHQLTRRVSRWSKLSNYDEIVTHIQTLAEDGSKSREIAAWLNENGYRTCHGALFTSENVRQLRSRALRVDENRG